MTPVIAAIVNAVAAGAAAALKDTTAQAVKDAYHAVKSHIQRRFRHVDLAAIERKPESESKWASLGEDFEDTGADEDEKLLELVEALAKAVEEHDPQAAETVGVNIEGLKSDIARFRRIKAKGEGVTGASVRDSEIGELEVEDVEADSSASSPEK